jgi:hypothetical protein
MAEHRNDDLLVVFSREGEPELRQVVENGDQALNAAFLILGQQDALRAGDSITVEWHKPATLVDRGLA